MPRRQPIELPYPLKGVNENWAYRRQPQGSSPDALNVRSFGEMENRLRGGQRRGISKYVEDVVAAGKAVLGLGTVSRAISATTIVAADTLASEDFTQEDGAFDAGEAVWACYTGTTATLTAVGSGDSQVVSNRWRGGSALLDRLLLWKTALTTTAYVISASVVAPYWGSTDEHTAYLYFRVSAASGSITNANYWTLQYVNWGGDGGARLRLYYNGSVEEETDTFSVTEGQIDSLQLINNGSGIEVLRNGILVLSHSSASLASNAYVGFGLHRDTASADARYIDNVTVLLGKVPDRLSRSDLVVVCDGDVYSGNRLALNKATGGDNAMYADRRISIQGAFGTGYLCDGAHAHYKKIDTPTNTVSAWTPTAGTLPRGSVDNTLACRIIVLYRGRIVMSGLVEEPHNWFMSAVGAPLDWDYAPAATSATMAVAGNNCDAGELGDVITALAPYRDDLLIFGGDHSIWMLRGDPAAGGVIDTISYQVGIAGQESWCFDPNGVFYFFGNGTVWQMSSAAPAPVPISRGVLDRTFQAIDIYQNRIILVWDVLNNGLHMFVAPLGQPDVGSEPTHYFWDQLTEAWWPDQYPNAQGPSTAIFFHDPQLVEQALLLGGWDGFIRRLDSAADDDDGTVIASHVDYSPIIHAGDLANSRLTELVPILGEGSGDISLEVYAGSSSEAAVKAMTPRFIRTISGGRNSSVRQRVNGNAIRIRLKSAPEEAQTWAMESMTGIIAVSGKARHGRL